MSASNPPPGSFEEARHVVRNCPADIDRVQSVLIDLASRYSYPKASLFALRLALQEAVSNAFRHGHRDLPPEAPVVVQFHVDAMHVRIRVRDSGPGFDPAAVPDPTLEANLNVASGRGLFIMKAYMESVVFDDNGSSVELTYRRPDID